MKWLFLFFLLFITYINYSQDITFDRIPSNLQFYPRDEYDSSIVPISGVVKSTKYNTIRIDIFKQNLQWKTLKQDLVFNNNLAPFKFTPKIHAELSEFKFSIYLDTVLIKTVDSVVCGDAYIIGGQSNAHPSDMRCKYKNEFCRTLGIQTTTLNCDPYNPKDTLWGLANGHGFGEDFGGPYLVGIWGMKLQQLILENYNIPTCIINGAAGASSINYNQRNDTNSLDLSSAYGRLLYRVKKAGLLNSVKAMIWHQGESDAYYPEQIALYSQKFNRLYSSWKSDYPGLKKVYLFQIRPGCADNMVTYQGQLREVQRTIPYNYKDVSIMSTAGISGHEACHYSLDGYNEMAEWIYRLIARDFYGSKDTLYITPPDIKRASYSDTSFNKIVLEFDQPLIVPRDSLNISIKDYFYFDRDTCVVSSVTQDSSKKILNLTLKNNNIYKKVTYIPEKHYYNSNLVYEGPWLTNLRGIGALTFNEFPIESPLTAIKYDHNSTIPLDILYQNNPNPFNSSSSILFKINQTGPITLEIFDILGKKVSTLIDGKIINAGRHRINVDLSGYSSGIYIYKLKAPGFTGAKKMILLN